MPQQVRESAPPRSRAEAGQRRRVLEMAKGLSATLGQDFFRSLVQHLGETLGADCAYVGELTGAHEDRMRTLAVYRKDGETEDFEQELSGTASGRVLLDGVYAFRRGAAQSFPRDTQLASLHAQGYAGIRLCDSAGQPIGLLAVVSREPLADTRVVKSLLETFAPRTAAELGRKKAEEVLRENEERYHAFISTNPDGMWRVEFIEPIPLALEEDEQLERMYRFGYLAECNDAGARMIGAENPKQVLGRPFDMIVPRRDARLQEELRSAIRSGFRATTVETTPRDENGNLQYRLRSNLGVVEGGALRRIWITTRDITSLRRAELSLAASERRFREVLEGVKLPAIMLDVHGAITFANACFLQLSQRSREELPALNWLAGIVPVEEAAIWKSILQPGQTVQQATTHFEGTVVPRDGGRRHALEWSTIGLRDRDDGFAEIAAIGRDITHERALEMEIRQAQKLDSVGQLAAGVAHDFNNLLTLIVGHAAPLLDQVEESDPKRPHLAAIEDAACLCTKLTGQLMAFGRKQHLNPELIVLNQTVASAEVIIHSLIGAGIEVKFDLQPDLWRVYADSTQMQRALANFVTNARDAMPQGEHWPFRHPIW